MLFTRFARWGRRAGQGLAELLLALIGISTAVTAYKAAPAVVVPPAIVAPVSTTGPPSAISTLVSSGTVSLTDPSGHVWTVRINK